MGKTDRSRTKEVIEKDKNGVVSGKTIYHFDKQGGVIERIDASFDEINNRFIKRKDKTYSRRADGAYDPDKTRYFDAKEREITYRSYNRDEKGMLGCEETKFVYTRTGKQVGSFLVASYDGGLWTKSYKEENIFDSLGHRIQNKHHKFSPKKNGLVCVKDKSYTFNTDGTCDPKETKYYDLEGRLTQHKSYHREQTELGSILFGDEENFTYQDGQTQVSKRSMFMMGNFWLEKDSFQSMVKAAQAKPTSDSKQTGDIVEEPAEQKITPQLLQQVVKMGPRD